MKDIINIVRNWTVSSFFPALDKHAKDSSKPVVDCLYDIDEQKKKRHIEATSETVKAIASLEKTVKGQHNEIINPEAIANPIVEAQNATTEAIKAIPEVHIPKFDTGALERRIEELKVTLEKKDMRVNIGKTVFDTKSIIDAIQKIKLDIPKMEQQEVIDYTLILDEQSGILETIRDKEKVDYTPELGAMLEWLKVISEKKYPELPEFSFSDTGRLKVEIDRTASGSNSAGITNKLGVIVNPASVDTLQAILSALGGTPPCEFMDYDGSGNLIYKGTNATESATGSESNWTITKYSYDGSGYLTSKKTLTGVWNSRTSISF